MFIFLFLIPFLGLHIFTFSQYGMQWDEAAQHHLGKATISYLKGDTEKIELQRPDLLYYGSWFEILNQFVGQTLTTKFGLSEVDAFHVLIFLTFLVGLVFFYRLTQKLFGEIIATYSLVFLVFLPRFMAHAHYNDKDIPLAVLNLIFLFFLYRGFFEKKFPSVILAGISFGLGLSLQVTSLQWLPIFFLPYVGYWLANTKSVSKKIWGKLVKQEMLLLCLFLIVSGFILYATWPALWSRPQLLGETIKYFWQHGWPGQVLYLGKIYAGNQVPWHYPLVYLFITTPALILIFSLFGIASGLTKLQPTKSNFKYLLFLSWLILPLALSLKPGIVKYDGIRHYLWLLPALALWAAQGATKIEAWFLKKKLPILLVSLWLVTLLSLGWENLKVYPYGDSYFNEILRLAVPAHIENVFELEYWGTSYREAAKWLNQYASGKATICVAIADHLLQFYPKRADLTFACNQDSSYLMFFTRKAYLPPNLEASLADQQPIFTLSRYNSELLKIYRLK